MAKEKFLIDSNSIITPFNSYYSFDISVKFWEQLKTKINDGSIIILDLVRDEILKGEDDLSNWFNNLEISTCISHKEQDIIAKYAEILQFIQQNPSYQESALREWAQEHIADAWLIATASVYNYTLITFERRQNVNPMNPSKMAKIPNIAELFNVNVNNLFYMMRKLDIKL